MSNKFNLPQVKANSSPGSAHISRIFKANRMHLTTMWGATAKGLKGFVNKIFQFSGKWAKNVNSIHLKLNGQKVR